MDFDVLSSALASAVDHDSPATPLMQALEAGARAAERSVVAKVFQPRQKRWRAEGLKSAQAKTAPVSTPEPSTAPPSMASSITQMLLSDMASVALETARETARAQEQSREAAVLEFSEDVQDAKSGPATIFSALSALPACEDRDICICAFSLGSEILGTDVRV